MNTRLFTACAVVTLAGCGDDQPADLDAKSVSAQSGIAVKYMDITVNPGDDFFAYVNGKWVAETEIPADRSIYGAPEIMRGRAQQHVREIIEVSASGAFAEGSDEQKIGDLYRSFMDMETRNEKGIGPLEPVLERIRSIGGYNDLAQYFAWASKHGYDVPFAIDQNEDMKDPQQYMIYVWQGGLSLPDRDYYLNNDESSRDIRAHYLAHIKAMFALLGQSDGEGAAEKVLQLETRLAAAHMSKEDARDFAKNYSKVALDKLGELMPGFDWDSYVAEAAIGDVDGLVVFMSDYMRALDAIIVGTELDTWRIYLTWSALNNAAALLSEEFDAQNFEFYGKVLSGTQEQRPNWRRGVNIVNETLGELVGKAYVEKHFSGQAKERIVSLVDNLLRAYEKSISELDWMGEKTRSEALDKLAKFTPKIGYPDRWRDYSAVDIKADDLFGNLERAAIADYERELARQSRPVDKDEWNTTPQTVNAFSTPWSNSITFPAAVLQPPFFNIDADDAVNYGAIGAVIGHEIGHGFDDQGSKFDSEGRLRDWWTEEDRAEFDGRADRLVKQYDAFRPFEDLAVNGRFTLGENIGDLGGLSIAMFAYQMSLAGKEAPVIDGFTGEQRVFLGWAQMWRRKYRDEELRRRIATDPHSPVQYRVNGTVRNMSAFYEAFDVQEGAGLYLPVEERVRIW